MISKEKITKISVTTATAIVIANMVGTGVFTSLGFQVLGVQSIFALLMLWVIGGILSFCGALSYSELGAAIPRSGGEYTYLSKIYHPAVGFLSGFVSVFVGFAAPIALAAMALGGYFCTVFPWFNPVWVGATVVVLITLVHSINLSIGSRFQNIVTTLKVLLILIFIVCGFVFGEHQPISVLPLQGSWKEIGSAAFAISLIFVSYAYSGWNASAYMAGEIENPQKNLPKSILSGTLIVMVLYILLNFIFLYTVPIAEMADSQGNPIIEIGALSAGKIFGNTGGNIMSLVISILLISTISSMVLAGPRVTMTIGEDIVALKFFAGKNKKGIPVIAIILQSLIALILIFTSSFDAVLTYLGFTLTLFTTLTVLGLFILRINKPDLPRPFKAWGYPITPAIFILLNLGIIYHSLTSKLAESLAGLGTVLIGLVIFYITQYYSKKSIKTF
ncbi:MAG TPA: amino acid permease [Bacteroidales bacterium]|nr:amino acid permease [Bacteroidales bacterium]